MTTLRKRIGVFPGSSRRTASRLLNSLAELYPVDFVAGTEAGFDRMDAAIFFSEEGVSAEQAFVRGVNALLFRPPSGKVQLPATATISFSGHAILHRAFRNAHIPLGSAATRVDDVPASQTGETLAFHDSIRLWVVRSSARRDGPELHTVAVEPPELRDSEFLWSYLLPQNWFGLLPLLHFLRRVTRHIDWSPSAQRACFIFDDPNLHFLRYGYLDFAELARDAGERNYHVALATVPLDAWHAGRKAVELFHRHPERLSLLIHGNDHVRDELAQEYGDDQGLRMLAQALTRIAGFESRTGLKVSRAIAAPHGGCSESLMAQMLRLPLEGACISVGPTVRCNPRKTWPLSFGLSPVCFMAEGFPVIRRFHLRHGGLLLLRFAAFLGQPILPYGHHYDCADGLGLLSQIADAVNSWGPAVWTDIQSIFRGHYRTRQEDSLMHVDLCARRARVSVPEDISHVVFHCQANEDVGQCEVAFSGTMQAQSWPLGVPIRAMSPTSLEISIPPSPAINPADVDQPAYRVWPAVRRVLAIGRDRATPILRGIGA